jgi:hypothetical protein
LDRPTPFSEDSALLLSTRSAHLPELSLGVPCGLSIAARIVGSFDELAFLNVAPA